MSEKQKTLAGIVAEKRELAQAIRKSLSVVPDRRDSQIAEAEELESDADRIEAAWERESKAIATENAVLPAVCITNRGNGDTAAMREADASRSDKILQAKSGFVVQDQEVFGRYCKIEMMRYGGPNEFFIHKCITILNSNFYTDVPVVCGEGNKWHEEGVDVVSVITCGLDESKVFRVPLKDVEFVSLPSNCYGQSGQMTSYGNEAAMREACQKMRDLLMLRGNGKTRCVLTWDEFNESQKMLRAALAAPPRNCDCSLEIKCIDHIYEFFQKYNLVMTEPYVWKCVPKESEAGE